MRIVGNVVGNGRELRIKDRKEWKIKIIERVKIKNGLRKRDIGMGWIWKKKREIMIKKKLKSLKRKVEEIEIRVEMIKISEDNERMGIMVKKEEIINEIVEWVIEGMEEGSVEEIMKERERLREVLIKEKRERKRKRNMRKIDGVSKNSEVMIEIMRDEKMSIVI